MLIDDLIQLQTKLDETKDWPAIYMFKFLAPAEQLENIKSLFPKAEAETKYSKKGNYVSVTFTPMMYDSARVIDTYQQAAELDGVMAF